MLLTHRTLGMKEIRRQTSGPDQTPTVDTHKDEDQLMIDGQCKPASKERGLRGKERRASKRTLRQKSEEIGVG